MTLNPQTPIPDFDPDTLETDVEDLYIAGSVACGCETWNIFIENGHVHALPIIADIIRKHHNPLIAGM